MGITSRANVFGTFLETIREYDQRRSSLTHGDVQVRMLRSLVNGEPKTLPQIIASSGVTPAQALDVLQPLTEVRLIEVEHLGVGNLYKITPEGRAIAGDNVGSEK